MVKLTHLIVMLYVLFLSCWQLETVMKLSVRFLKFPRCRYAELFQSLPSH